MKVLFLEDVSGVAQGGEVKDVKNGFARNYLLPQRLAVLANADAMQRVNRLKRQAEETRLKTLSDMRALAEEMDGVQVNVEMRAGASGRLYGSVTNAVVAAQLSEMTGREVDRRTVEIAEPIRETGRFTLRMRLHADVDANIIVLVHPMDADPEEFLASIVEKEERAAGAGESDEAEGEAQDASAEAEAEAVSEEAESPADEAESPADAAEAEVAPSGDAESAEATSDDAESPAEGEAEDTPSGDAESAEAISDDAESPAEGEDAVSDEAESAEAESKSAD